MKKPSILTLIFLTPLSGIAQNAAATEQTVSFLDKYSNEIILGILLMLVVLILWMILLWARFVIRIAAHDLDPELREELGTFRLLPPLGFDLGMITRKLTDAVPISQEKDIMLDHDYDGIRELDNHLPPWWKWMFYATIVWGIGYFTYYHIFKAGDDQYERYEKQMALAEIQKQEYLAKMANNVDESNVTLLTEASDLGSGRSIFNTNCVQCHGENAEGKIGPNLTDAYWIHGGDITSVFKVVKYGVANKMQAWESQLLPSQMQQVSSYVLSLQGTNPPDAKGPEGELYVPEENTGEGDVESQEAGTNAGASEGSEV